VRDGGAYGCAVPRAYANLNPGLGRREVGFPILRLFSEYRDGRSSYAKKMSVFIIPPGE